MLTLITPHLQVETIHELPPSRLRALGLDGLLLDVDSTLKDHRATAFPDETIAWVKNLSSAGVRLCLLSNGRPRRIGPLAATLGVPFVGHAYKPFPFRCRKALRRLGLDRSRVGVVGDQVFADVLAGRLAGLFTILVRPTSPDEPWFTRIKRPLERRVLQRIGPRCPEPATPAGVLP